MKVGIAGASGYAGAELLRLCASHPDLEVVVATAGEHAGGRWPAIPPRWPPPSRRSATRRPRRRSWTASTWCSWLCPTVAPAPGARPADRGGEGGRPGRRFPAARPGSYPAWYGSDHQAPELLEQLRLRATRAPPPELRGAELVAVPGCYPTAAILALAPPACGLGMLDRGDPPLIVDAASGVSGAGRAPTEALHFGTVDEDFVAYGLLDHRHTPEMEQGLGAQVLFTPHLAPMVRGILATCYGRPTAGATDHHRRGHGRSPRGATTASPSWWSPTVAVDQGHHRVQLRPPHRPGRPAHGLGDGHLRHRQPDQGGGGAGRTVRQSGPRPGRGDRVAGGRGLSVSITTPAGFVAAGLAAGSRRPAPSTSPSWPPRTATRCPPPPLSPPTGPPPPRCG